MSDEHPPPESDPMLHDVWADMSPTERLLYMAHEGEPVPPEVTERAKEAFHAQPRGGGNHCC